MPTFVKYNFSVQSMTKYSNNQLLLENYYCFENEELGIDTDVERFAVVDNNSRKSSKKVIGEFEYFTFNVVGGDICVNQEKNSVVFAQG